jgi:tripartite-type tricarboxylate transporter receptor subunit TctC
MNVNSHFYKKNAGFDLQKDSITVARATKAPYVLIARAGLQASNMRELVALSKTRTDGLAYASKPASPQAAGELFVSDQLTASLAQRGQNLSRVSSVGEMTGGSNYALKFCFNRS